MSKKKSSKSTKLRITRPKVEREDEEHEDEPELEVEEEREGDEEEGHDEPEHEPEPEEEPEQEHEPEPEPEPAKPHKPAPKKKGPAHGGNLEEWEIQLKDRLQFISDYQEVTLPQFRNFTSLGSDSRRVIDSYVAQDLLERTWRQAAGRYKLSEKGVALLNELTARSGS